MRKLRTIEMKRLSVEQFRDADKLPLIVVLDDVRSLYNVGSVFRTCDAFRVQALYLCGITATPPHSEIHKTALGAEDSVAWKHFPTADDAVAYLHREGWKVYAIEQAEGSIMLQEWLSAPSQPSSHTPSGFAIIFGNEVKGVHQSVIDACDGCIEIPQYGTKHSMNVSVTAGIVIWEIVRQWTTHLLSFK